jgi:hypothetical protein
MVSVLIKCIYINASYNPRGVRSSILASYSRSMREVAYNKFNRVCVCVCVCMYVCACERACPFPHKSETFDRFSCSSLYQSRLKSSWTRHIAPSRNFVEMRWRSLFRSTSLGKRCTSYNAPPASRKRAADRWWLGNFLPRSSLFMVEKAQKSHGARSELNSVFGLGKWIGGTPLEHPSCSPDISPCDLWAFPVVKRELRGKKFRSDERSAVRCKKCIACQGRYFEEETVTALPQSFDSE